jgi:threonine/homoserine/homoserine lactone efflux protein
VVATITPGPNNLMLINVGLARGHLAAVRTGIGVSSGWGTQVLVCGLGIGAMVHAIAGLSGLVDVVGLCYLSFLAWKLWHTDHLAKAARMHGLFGAYLFQWINPKALSMSLTTAGLFVVRGGGLVPVRSALVVALGATILCIPSTLVWGLSGAALRARFERPRFAARFNRVAALTLLAMVVWLVVVSA